MSDALVRLAEEMNQCDPESVDGDPMMEPDNTWCPEVALPPELGGGTLRLSRAAEFARPADLELLGVSWIVRLGGGGWGTYAHLLSQGDDLRLLGVGHSLTQMEWRPKLPISTRNAPIHMALPPGLDQATRAALAAHREDRRAPFTLTYDECEAMFGFQCRVPDGLYSDLPPTEALEPLESSVTQLLYLNVLYKHADMDFTVAIQIEPARSDSFALEAAWWDTSAPLRAESSEPVSELAPQSSEVWCHLFWPYSESTVEVDQQCSEIVLAEAYAVSAAELPENLSADPGPVAYEYQMTSDSLRLMRERVAPLCPELDFDADRSCVRTLEAIDNSLARKGSVYEDVNIGSFGPQLCKVLNGERLTEADLFLHTDLRFSHLTAAKLQAAVKVRAGYLPVSEDMKALFLAPREDAEAPCLPIAPPSGHAQVKDEVDQDNDFLIVRGMRGADY